jgi:hypothetical protein
VIYKETVSEEKTINSEFYIQVLEGSLSVFGKVTISTERQLIPSAPTPLLILQQHVKNSCRTMV